MKKIYSILDLEASNFILSTLNLGHRECDILFSIDCIAFFADLYKTAKEYNHSLKNWQLSIIAVWENLKDNRIVDSIKEMYKKARQRERYIFVAAFNKLKDAFNTIAYNSDKDEFKAVRMSVKHSKRYYYQLKMEKFN